MTVRIDAHHHVWDLAVRPQPWAEPFPVLHRSYTLDDLRPALAAGAIDRTVLVQTVTVAAETPELLALAADEPSLAGVVGWVDLTALNVADELGRLQDGLGGRHLVGIRHQVQEEHDVDWLAREPVRRGLRSVAAQQLAYDLVIRREQLPSAASAARAVPELRFILDHGGNPAIAAGEVEPWRSDLSAFAALPNTAVKLSGLVTQTAPDWSVDDLRPYADHLLEAFGPARVLFGSDWPACLLRASYEEVVSTAEALTAGLTVDERAAVFGGNAVAWYRVEPETA
jgi:L-fuconolactonase